MSFFDQDQTIDYSNKYNENIGSISPPKSRNQNMINPRLGNFQSSKINKSFLAPDTLCRYSDYDQFEDDDQPDGLLTEDFEPSNMQNSNYNGFKNDYDQFNHDLSSSTNQFQSINSQNQQTNNDKEVTSTKSNEKWSKPFRATGNFMTPGDFIYLYEDVTDSMVVYQTENTPICFSYDSPLSDLSLEFLPSINNMNANSTNNLAAQNNVQNTELNSSGDSVINYNTESTPICFSYDSPLSDLSLGFDGEDGEMTPNTLEFINDRIQKNKQKEPADQDITSMISNMSIENGVKTRSTKSSTERLNSSKFGHLNSERDDYSLLGFETSHSESFKATNHLDNRQSNIKPNLLNPVIDQQNKEQSSLRNENYYQDRHSPIDDFEKGFSEYDIDEELYLNKCISFGRLASNKSSIQKTNTQQQRNIPLNQPLNHQFDSSPVHHHYQFENNQSPVSSSKQTVKLDNETDIATTITTFSKNYCSRSMYKIDGEETEQHQSVAYAPIHNYNPASFQRQSMQKHQLVDQQSNLNETSTQVKSQKHLKNFLNVFKSKNKKKV